MLIVFATKVFVFAVVVSREFLRKRSWRCFPCFFFFLRFAADVEEVESTALLLC